jgi:ornithine carbamoyltransferase
MGANSEAVQKALSVRKSRRMRTLAPPPRSLLTLMDLSPQEFHDLITAGAKIKANPRDYVKSLERRQVALVFQKTSTRTRVSFETGVAAMGGNSLYMDWKTSNFTLASLRDEIRVLSRYVDLTIARVFGHEDIVEMAAHSEVPIINGLSDQSHPCQGLADFMTAYEYFGTLADLHFVYIGDGNNVASSLMEAALLAKASITVCSPRRFAPNGALVQDLLSKGLQLRLVDKPEEAVRDADVIYTDTWVSMGEEHMAEEKVQLFSGFQVNAALLAKAPKHAVLMHCLPAHRGQEISDEAMDSEQSIIFDQAENRRYVQQALMVWLLDAKS